ncbi:uncharacterized protein LOC143828500 [Paroedura picta]|uniref:uncharacterized protein LOC143828500 n=1 Tax=Paroedura picta TaxID=143630 RepID=UPI004055A0E6
MKFSVLTLGLFCFHFESCVVDGSCPSCPNPCQANHNVSIPEAMDGFSRGAVTFHCPLTEGTVGFHMKLLKGRNREELCSFYAEHRKEKSSTESCNPVFSDNQVSFELRNSSTEVDTYICCLESLVPTYSCCVTRETNLYLYIHNPQSQDSKECFLSEFTSWTLVVLTACSTVSFICCFLFCCLRVTVFQHSAHSCDYNNEYMSMAAVMPKEKSRREQLRKPVPI